MHRFDLTLAILLSLALLLGCAPRPDGGDTGLPEDEHGDPAGDDDDDDPIGDGDDDDAPLDDDDDDGEPTGCMDDYEDNDDALSAAPVSVGSVEDLTLCDGDEDFFTVALIAGDYVTVDVSFLDADGDVDLQLIGFDGEVIDSSTSVADGETVGALIAADGDYLVRAYLYADGGEVGQEYGLDVAVGDAPETPEEPEPVPCADDAFIDNTEAAPAAVGPGTWDALAVCDGSEDWFTVDVEAGQILTVDLFFAHAEGDIDLRVGDPDGTWQNSLSVDDDESVTIDPTSAGTYLVRVHLYADAGSVFGNEYDLVVDLQ